MLLEDGTVKIMDFGIAKLGGTGVTKTGMMVGTIHYMSPEQIRGKKLDGRSDVFSSGVILYELPCGKRPFVGDRRDRGPLQDHQRPARDPRSSVAGVAPRAAGDPRPRARPRTPRRAMPRRRAWRRSWRRWPSACAGRASARRRPTSWKRSTSRAGWSRRARSEDALHRLQDVTQRHPRSIEARRACAPPPGERERRLAARAGGPDFPELERDLSGLAHAAHGRRP